METGKAYPVFSFSIKCNSIGRYLVAANDLEAAKKYVHNIHNSVSPIKIDIGSGIELKTLKYICPDYMDKYDAICVVNALSYKYKYPYE